MSFAASQFWSWLGEGSNNKHDINPADTEYHWYSSKIWNFRYHSKDHKKLYVEIELSSMDFEIYMELNVTY